MSLMVIECFNLEYGKFLHSKGKIFSDFNEINKERFNEINKEIVKKQIALPAVTKEYQTFQSTLEFILHMVRSIPHYIN